MATVFRDTSYAINKAVFSVLFDTGRSGLSLFLHTESLEKYNPTSAYETARAFYEK
jgi:hypothetical protein